MSPAARRPNLISELKRAGIIRSDQDTADFLDAIRTELAAREIADAYLAPTAEASYNFFHDLVVPKKWQPDLGDIHRDMGHFVLQAERSCKLILLPRETLKTTRLTISEVTRNAIANPEARFLLGHAKHKKSMQFLGAIKGVLLKPRVQELFGDLLPHNDKNRPDNGEMLTIATRSELAVKEATFTTTGIDKTEQSGHYTHGVFDDLVIEENAPIGADPEQLERPIKYYKSLWDLMDKEDPRMWFIGTWHHPNDLYGHIQEVACNPHCREANDDNREGPWIHMPECGCDFDVMIRGLKDKDGKYIYRRFNKGVEDRLERNKGVWDMARHYNNNPTDPSTCWLKTSEIKAMKVSPATIMEMRQRHELIIYQLIDPAESKKKNSAFTAIVTVGIHKVTGHWYIMGAVKERVETRAFIDLIFEQHRKFKPYQFAMEANTRKALKFVLEEKMKTDRYFFEITDLNPRTNDGPDEKRRRFKQNVVPLFQYGQVHCDDTLRDMILFLSTCPQARYWDLGDCLSYLPEIAPTIKPVDELPPSENDYDVELFEGTGM